MLWHATTDARSYSARDRLAVLLPGLRYGPEMPLLADTAQMLRARGTGVMTVRFAYAEDAGFLALDDAAQIARIRADGAAILDAARATGAGRLVLVGKSAGTVAMMGMGADAATEHIWLTPSLIGTGLAPVIAARGGFVLIGARDPALRQAEALRDLPGVTLCRIAGADHGWNGPSGDGADLVTPAMQALADWLDTPPS